MDRDTLEVVKGAEAVVALRGHSVVKQRVPKDYRIVELDTKLRRERTRLEAKIQSDARRAGVPTPIIEAVDGFSITMERIESFEIMIKGIDYLVLQFLKGGCEMGFQRMEHGRAHTRPFVPTLKRHYELFPVHEYAGRVRAVAGHDPFVQSDPGREA